VSRQQAVAETNRAEAQKLIAFGQLGLLHPTESDPTMSLSYALASLELADSYEARILALKALWKRPPRLQIQMAQGWGVDFSPDGRQLAVGIRGGKSGSGIRTGVHQLSCDLSTRIQGVGYPGSGSRPGPVVSSRQCGAGNTERRCGPFPT
jgi:hypothetical protein